MDDEKKREICRKIYQQVVSENLPVFKNALKEYLTTGKMTIHAIWDEKENKVVLKEVVNEKT